MGTLQFPGRISVQPNKTGSWSQQSQSYFNCHTGQLRSTFETCSVPGQLQPTAEDEDLYFESQYCFGGGAGAGNVHLV